MSLDIKTLERIARYEQYNRFYENDLNAQEKALLDVDARFYIAANIVKSIVDVTPDFLFGEAPRITATNQELIDTIISTTNFNTLFYRAALTSSLKGDGVIKLYLVDGAVKAQLIQPEFYYPVRDINDELSQADFLTEIDSDDNFVYYLRENITKSHIKRFIEKRVHKTGLARETALDANLVQILPVTEHPLTKELKPEEENIFHIIPIIHIPNYLTTDDCFGKSDLEGSETLVLAINKRLSEIDYIITKHADPKLQVPQNVLDAQMGANIIASSGTTFVHQDGIDNKAFKVIESSPNDKDMKYVQPNLDLTSAFDELDRLVNYLLLQTKTSPSLVQSYVNNGTAESGKALRLRLMDTERKLRQKKAYYYQAIKAFFDMAHVLLGANTQSVDIQFIDLLNDATENIDNAIKLRDKNLISHREALELAFPNTSKQEVDRMLLEVLEENLNQAQNQGLSAPQNQVLETI